MVAYLWQNINGHFIATRTYVIMQIEQYIEGERDVPLVIAGSSGSGKSSILAAAVNRSLLKQVLYLFPISVLLFLVKVYVIVISWLFN